MAYAGRRLRAESANRGTYFQKAQNAGKDRAWGGFINNKEVYLKNNAGELYFEVSDIDEFYKRLQTANIEYVHELLEHPWGQRVVRFYDPDCHIIEVAEDISMVAKRFFHNGMTVGQVAERMDVPADYIKKCLES